MVVKPSSTEVVLVSKGYNYDDVAKKFPRLSDPMDLRLGLMENVKKLRPDLKPILHKSVVLREAQDSDDEPSSKEKKRKSDDDSEDEGSEIDDSELDDDEIDDSEDDESGEDDGSELDDSEDEGGEPKPKKPPVNLDFAKSETVSEETSRKEMLEWEWKMYQKRYGKHVEIENFNKFLPEDDLAARLRSIKREATYNRRLRQYLNYLYMFFYGLEFVFVFILKNDAFKEYSKRQGEYLDEYTEYMSEIVSESDGGFIESASPQLRLVFAMALNTVTLYMTAVGGGVLSDIFNVLKFQGKPTATNIVENGAPERSSTPKMAAPSFD